MSKARCTRSADSAVVRRVPVEMLSRECRELKEALKATCLDNNFIDQYWRIDKIELIENDRLQKNYDTYKREHAYTSRKNDRLKDTFVFSAETQKACDEICHEGHKVGMKKRHVLGYTGSGVHLVRNYDILTRYMTFQQFSAPASIIVYKACLGKVKHVLPRLFKDDRFVNPYCGFSCHVSAKPIKTTMPICEAINCSYAYFYEFDDISSNTVKYPRQILPYAILHLQRKSPVTIENPFLAVASGNVRHGMEVKGETRRGFRFIFTKPVPRCKRPSGYGGKGNGEVKSKQNSKTSDLQTIKEQLREMRTRSSKVSETVTKYEYGSRLHRRCSRNFFQKRRPHGRQRLRDRDTPVDYTEVCDDEHTAGNKVKKQNRVSVLPSTLTKPSSSMKLVEEAKECFKDTCLSTFDGTNHIKSQGNERSAKIGELHYVGDTRCTLPLSLNPIVALKRLDSSVHTKKCVIIGAQACKRKVVMPARTEKSKGTHPDVYEFSDECANNDTNAEANLNSINETTRKQVDKSKCDANQAEGITARQFHDNSPNIVKTNANSTETKTEMTIVKTTPNIQGDLKTKLSLAKLNETKDTMDLNTKGDDDVCVKNKDNTPHCKENKTQSKLNDKIANLDHLNSANPVKMTSGVRVTCKEKIKEDSKDGSEVKNKQTDSTSHSGTLPTDQDINKKENKVNVANEHQSDNKERTKLEKAKGKRVTGTLNCSRDLHDNNLRQGPGGNKKDQTSLNTSVPSETLNPQRAVDVTEGESHCQGNVACKSPNAKGEECKRNEILQTDNSTCNVEHNTMKAIHPNTKKQCGKDSVKTNLSGKTSEKSIGTAHRKDNSQCNSLTERNTPTCESTKQGNTGACTSLEGTASTGNDAHLAQTYETMLRVNTLVLPGILKHSDSHISHNPEQKLDGEAITPNNSQIGEIDSNTEQVINTNKLSQGKGSHLTNLQNVDSDKPSIMKYSGNNSTDDSTILTDTPKETRPVSSNDPSRENIHDVSLSVYGKSSHPLEKKVNSLGQSSHAPGKEPTDIRRNSRLLEKPHDAVVSSVSTPSLYISNSDSEKVHSSKIKMVSERGQKNSKNSDNTERKVLNTSNISKSEPGTDLNHTVTKTDLNSTVTKTDLNSTSTKTDLNSMVTKTDLNSTGTKTDLNSTGTKTEQKSGPHITNVLQSDASILNTTITCTTSRDKPITHGSSQCLHLRTGSDMSQKHVSVHESESKSDIGNTVDSVQRGYQNRSKSKSNASANSKGKYNSGNTDHPLPSNKPASVISNEQIKGKRDIPTSCQNNTLSSGSSIMSDGTSKLHLETHGGQSRDSCQSLTKQSMTSSSIEVSNSDNLPKLDDLVDWKNFTNVTSDKNTDRPPKLHKMNVQTPNMKRKHSPEKTMDVKASKTYVRTSISNTQTAQQGHGDKVIVTQAIISEKHAFPSNSACDNKANTVFAPHSDQKSNMNTCTKPLLRDKQLHTNKRKRNIRASNTSTMISQANVSHGQLQTQPSGKLSYQSNSGQCMNADQLNVKSTFKDTSIVETSLKASSPALAVAAPALLNCTPKVASAQTANRDSMNPLMKATTLSKNSEKESMNNQQTNTYCNKNSPNQQEVECMLNTNAHPMLPDSTHSADSSGPILVSKHLAISKSQCPKPNTCKANSTIVDVPHLLPNPITSKDFTVVSRTNSIRPGKGSSINPSSITKMAPPITNLMNYRHNCPSLPSRRYLLLDSNTFSSHITQAKSVQQVIQASQYADQVYNPLRDSATKTSLSNNHQPSNVDVARSSLEARHLLSKDNSQIKPHGSEIVSSINKPVSCAPPSQMHSFAGVVHSGAAGHSTTSSSSSSVVGLTDAKAITESNNDSIRLDISDKQNDVDKGTQGVRQDIQCLEHGNVPYTTGVGNFSSQIDVETVKSRLKHFLRDKGPNIRQNLTSKQHVNVSTPSCVQQDTKTCSISTAQNTSEHSSIGNMLTDSEIVNQANGSQMKFSHELGNVDLLLLASKALEANDTCESSSLGSYSSNAPTDVKINAFKECTDTDSNDTIIGGIQNYPVEIEVQSISDEVNTYEYTLEHLSEVEPTSSEFISPDKVTDLHKDTETTNGTNEAKTKASCENHPIKPRLSIFDTLTSSIVSTEQTCDTGMDKEVLGKVNVIQNTSTDVFNAEPIQIKQEPHVLENNNSSEKPSHISTEAFVEDTIDKAEDKSTSVPEPQLAKQEPKPLSFFSRLTERKRAVAESSPKSKEQCKSAIVQTLQELSEVLKFLNGNKEGGSCHDTIEDNSVKPDVLNTGPTETLQSDDSTTKGHQRNRSKTKRDKTSVDSVGKVDKSQSCELEVKREQIHPSSLVDSGHKIDLLKQRNRSSDNTEKSEPDIGQCSDYVQETVTYTPTKAMAKDNAKPETPQSSNSNIIAHPVKLSKHSHDRVTLESIDKADTARRCDLEVKREHIDASNLFHSIPRTDVLQQHNCSNDNAQETNEKEPTIDISQIKTEPMDPPLQSESISKLSRSKSNNLVNTNGLPKEPMPDTSNIEHQSRLDTPCANFNNSALVETPLDISDSKMKDHEGNPAETSDTLEGEQTEGKTEAAHDNIDETRVTHKLSPNPSLEKEVDELPKLFDYKSGPDISYLEIFGVSEMVTKKHKKSCKAAKSKANDIVMAVTHIKDNPKKIDTDANNTAKDRRTMNIAENCISTNVSETANPLPNTLDSNNKLQTEENRNTDSVQNCILEPPQSKCLPSARERSDVLQNVRNAIPLPKDNNVKPHSQREVQIPRNSRTPRKAGSLNKGVRERKNMFDIKVNSKRKSFESWKNFTATKSVQELLAAKIYVANSLESNWVHKSTGTNYAQELKSANHVDNSMEFDLVHKSSATDSVQEFKVANNLADSLLSTGTYNREKFEEAPVQSSVDHNASSNVLVSGLSQSGSHPQDGSSTYELSKAETQLQNSGSMSEVDYGISMTEVDNPPHISEGEAIVSRIAHADSTTAYGYTHEDKSTMEITVSVITPIKDYSDNVHSRPLNDTKKELNPENEMYVNETKPNVTSSSNFEMLATSSEENKVSKHDCTKKSDTRNSEMSKKRKSHKTRKHNDVIPYDVVMRRKCDQHLRFLRGETTKKFIDYDEFKAELKMKQKRSKMSKSTDRQHSTETQGNTSGAANAISARGTHLYEDFDSDEERMPDTGNELYNKRKRSRSHDEADDELKVRRKSDRSDSSKRSESSHRSRSRSKSKPSEASLSSHPRSNSRRQKRDFLQYPRTSPTVQNTFDTKFNRRYTPRCKLSGYAAENHQRPYRSPKFGRGALSFKRNGTGYFQWRRKYGQHGEPYTITRKGSAQTFEEFVEWKRFKEREKIRTQIEDAVREYRETFGRTDKAKDKKVASYLEFLTQSVQKDNTGDNVRQRDYPSVRMETPAQQTFTQFPKTLRKKSKPNPQVRARNRLKGIVNSVLQLQEEHSKSNGPAAVVGALKLENPSAPLGNSVIEHMFREHMQQHFESISQRFKEELTGKLIDGMNSSADNRHNTAIGNNLRWTNNEPLVNVLPHSSATLDCQHSTSRSKTDNATPDNDRCFLQRNTHAHIAEVTRDQTRSGIEDHLIPHTGSSGQIYLGGVNSGSIPNVPKHSVHGDLNAHDNEYSVRDCFSRGAVASPGYENSPRNIQSVRSDDQNIPSAFSEKQSESNSRYKGSSCERRSQDASNMYKEGNGERNMCMPNMSGNSNRRTLLETPKNITPRLSGYGTQRGSTEINDSHETSHGNTIPETMSQFNKGRDSDDSTWSGKPTRPYHRASRGYKRGAHTAGYKDNPPHSEFAYDAYEYSNYSRFERQREMQQRGHAHLFGHSSYRDRHEYRQRTNRGNSTHRIYDERSHSKVHTSREHSPARKYRSFSSENRTGKGTRHGDSKHKH